MLLSSLFIDVKLVSEHKEISKRGIKNTKQVIAFYCIIIIIILNWAQNRYHAIKDMQSRWHNNTVNFCVL